MIHAPKLYFLFMYFYLTKKSGHSVKSQSPAGQSAAHFTLRNSPRPKGITKLVRERGYCPHLVHVELQQSIMLVPCCSKNGLSLGPYMTNLTFNFSQNNSNWLWSLTPKRKKKKKVFFVFPPVNMQKCCCSASYIFWLLDPTYNPCSVFLFIFGQLSEPHLIYSGK